MQRDCRGDGGADRPLGGEQIGLDAQAGEHGQAGRIVVDRGDVVGLGREGAAQRGRPGADLVEGEILGPERRSGEEETEEGSEASGGGEDGAEADGVRLVALPGELLGAAHRAARGAPRGGRPGW